MAIFRVTLTMTQYQQIFMQNVLHFDWHDFAGPMSQVTTEIQTGWIEIMRQAQVSSIRYRNITVYQVGSGLTPTNLPLDLPGLDIADPNQSMPTLSVKMRIGTGIAGKKGRGRIYVPGVRQGHWVAGQLSAAGITTWTARANALIARYVGPTSSGPMVLGVSNRTEDVTAFKQADSLTVMVIPGCQRRRNLGVGI